MIEVKGNILDSFKVHIENYGIPDRLFVMDSFGYWFSGFFDGEGSFGIHIGKQQYVLNMSVTLREDDANVLLHMKKRLDVGTLSKNKARGATKTQIRKIRHGGI